MVCEAGEDTGQVQGEVPGEYNYFCLVPGSLAKVCWADLVWQKDLLQQADSIDRKPGD